MSFSLHSHRTGLKLVETKLTLQRTIFASNHVVSKVSCQRLKAAFIVKWSFIVIHFYALFTISKLCSSIVLLLCNVKLQIMFLLYMNMMIIMNTFWYIFKQYMYEFEYTKRNYEFHPLQLIFRWDEVQDKITLLLLYILPPAFHFPPQQIWRQFSWKPDQFWIIWQCQWTQICYCT